jgi:hypothetical protein
MSKAGHCPTPTAGILAAVALLLGGAGGLLGICGPFIDVSDPDFCQPVLEIFILGITTGATPTTYSPADPVDRLQMAGFLSRAVDTALKRGSRREALGQFWTPKGQESLAITTLPGTLEQVACDGADVWVAILDGSVTRIRASDGRVLRSWRGAQRAFGILAAMGRIVVLGTSSPGLLYTIDPSEPEGAVESQATLVAANLGNSSFGITFDGARIWTANNGTVSIVTPSASIPWTVTNVTVGFVLSSALFDGANVWVTDANAGTLIGWTLRERDCKPSQSVRPPRSHASTGRTSGSRFTPTTRSPSFGPPAGPSSPRSRETD